MEFAAPGALSCTPVEGFGSEKDVVGRPPLSGWLLKRKNESTGRAGRLFSGATNKRYFTLDFGSRIFYYSRAVTPVEGGKQKDLSLPVAFHELTGAELLTPLAASTSSSALAIALGSAEGGNHGEDVGPVPPLQRQNSKGSLVSSLRMPSLPSGLTRVASFGSLRRKETAATSEQQFPIVVRTLVRGSTSRMELVCANKVEAEEWLGALQDAIRIGQDSCEVVSFDGSAANLSTGPGSSGNSSCSGPPSEPGAPSSRPSTTSHDNASDDVFSIPVPCAEPTHSHSAAAAAAAAAAPSPAEVQEPKGRERSKESAKTSPSVLSSLSSSSSSSSRRAFGLLPARAPRPPKIPLSNNSSSRFDDEASKQALAAAGDLAASQAARDPQLETSANSMSLLADLSVLDPLGEPSPVQQVIEDDDPSAVRALSARREANECVAPFAGGFCSGSSSARQGAATSARAVERFGDKSEGLTLQQRLEQLDFSDDEDDEEHNAGSSSERKPVPQAPLPTPVAEKETKLATTTAVVGAHSVEACEAFVEPDSDED